MTVRVIGFARIREIVGSEGVEWSTRDGATVAECFAELCGEFPALVGLEHSLRFVQDAGFVDGSSVLHDGDELGLLPPFGGG